MPDTVFLDTNVILDYLEKRDKDVRAVVTRLLSLNRQGRVSLATSILNIAELIDKEFEISFCGWAIKKRLSYDEIMRRLRGSRKLFEEISQRNRSKVEQIVKDFIEKNEVALLYLPVDNTQWYDVCEQGFECFLTSQDLIMVAIAQMNNVTYFLSNDQDLVRKLSESGLFYVFNLHDIDQRETFIDNVLEVL